MGPVDVSHSAVDGVVMEPPSHTASVYIDGEGRLHVTQTSPHGRTQVITGVDREPDLYEAIPVAGTAGSPRRGHTVRWTTYQATRWFSNRAIDALHKGKWPEWCREIERAKAERPLLTCP